MHDALHPVNPVVILERLPMPVLTDVIQIIPPDRDEDPEDIFAAAPGLIFTDDFQNLHGDKGYTIVYKSKWGPIELKTADPQAEGERQLFSHYLWNASISLAERISYDGDSGNNTWSVKGERVLELGAGVGLDGIVASLAGAETVGIYAIAGFHTGRRKLAPFFTVAVEQGLELEDIFEEDGEGNRRDWRAERDGGREDPTERKKWLVIATLKRRS
ncbi:hypothetical protein KC338_g1435 [Hortaea werneckii]|nr:hypothetical protein KC338_g1435 [Hortaea werneckii]